LRFLTSYPRDFSDDALDAMAAAPRICRYLHLPVQSGSNAVLQRMNRGYTIEEYEALLERARSRMPDVRLAGDMIAGFAGETDADHQASVQLLRRARYKSCFVFKYSPRSGTVAERRLEDDVPEGVKKARNLELLETQAEISLALHESSVGSVLDVLVEDFGTLRKDTVQDGIRLGWRTAPRNRDWVRLRGRTTGDEIVAFDGPENLVGSLTRVRATRATQLTILGEWAEAVREEAG
jgi:tRNA-2-methylthio-N6-dimethylallyladenosine synthase